MVYRPTPERGPDGEPLPGLAPTPGPTLVVHVHLHPGVDVEDALAAITKRWRKWGVVVGTEVPLS